MEDLKTLDNLPACPAHPYCEETVSLILEIAKSYVAHADRLIYSFGSKTFLSGYDLFDADHQGRGNIDCSTFVYLVLAGIPYEQSPYATGKAKELPLNPLTELDFSCLQNLPDRYLNIAERIGRPYLSCPKGLDLEKAEAMGISKEVLMEEIKKSGMSRRSVDLARQFLQQRACFTDTSYLMPGDLVFYQSKTFFKDGKFRPASIMEVTHVGIVDEDTHMMVNSSGYLDKERAERESLPAVSIAPVTGKRIPLFYARPAYLTTRTAPEKFI